MLAYHAHPVILVILGVGAPVPTGDPSWMVVLNDWLPARPACRLQPPGRPRWSARWLAASRGCV